MKKSSKQLFSKVSQGAVTGLVAFLVLGVGYTFAQPTQAPGSGPGVSLPINEGAGAQTKAGALTVDGGLTTSALTASTICLAGDCQSSWPSGGGFQSGSGSNYQSPSYLYNYNQNQYGYLTYYSNGSPYSQYMSYANSHTFSITISAPGQVLSTSNKEVRCYHNWNGSAGQYNTYDYYTLATDVNSNIDGSSVILTGTCNTSTNLGGYVHSVGSASYLYAE